MAPASISRGIIYILHVGSERVSLKFHDEIMIVKMHSPKI
jgi:hypothetical protein